MSLLASSFSRDDERGGDLVSQEVAGAEDGLEAAEEGDEEGEARGESKT